MTDLTKALSGQDVLVSAISTFAVAEQIPIIDAAIAAGVKRVIPAEYGVNTRKLGPTGLGEILGKKREILDYIIEKTKSHPEFTWTALAVGGFFDLVCNHLLPFL